MADTPSDPQSPSGSPPVECPQKSSGSSRRLPGPSLASGPRSDCDGCFSMVLGEFAKSFDKSAKRWELIVYPSLFAFIVLAMYGFFLIYSLTQDIRTMSSSIDPQMGKNMGSLSLSIRHLSDNVEMMSTHLEYISDNMETMSVDMQSMSESVDTMTDAVQVMSTHVGSMSRAMEEVNVKMNVLPTISTNMAAMNQSMYVMTNSVGRMGRDVGRPMSFINQFMPWGN
ncbi:MAG: hypothetical protein HQL51_04830 [Magnetococcales bacterium]|nr:hypothetical protein [Magnetococcales bacterium]